MSHGEDLGSAGGSGEEKSETAPLQSAGQSAPGGEGEVAARDVGWQLQVVVHAATEQAGGRTESVMGNGRGNLCTQATERGQSTGQSASPGTVESGIGADVGAATHLRQDLCTSISDHMSEGSGMGGAAVSPRYRRWDASASNLEEEFYNWAWTCGHESEGARQRDRRSTSPVAAPGLATQAVFAVHSVPQDTSPLQPPTPNGTNDGCSELQGRDTRATGLPQEALVREDICIGGCSGAL